MLKDVIRSKLKEKGMSNLELVEKSGLPLSTVNKIINGLSLSPRLDTLEAIATALDCSIDDFVSKEGLTPEQLEAMQWYERYKRASASKRKAIDALLEDE